MPRIIDRDIAFYQGEVEYAHDLLRRVRPALEPVFADRVRSAQAVLDALEAYRLILDLQDGEAVRA